MKGDLAIRTLNWALGIWYVVWVVLALWLGRRGRRRPDDPRPRRRQRRLGRIGLIVGVLALVAGVAVPRLASTTGHELELLMGGAVYLLTALVVWARLRAGARPTVTGETGSN